MRRPLLIPAWVPRRFDVELPEAGGKLTASFTVLGIDRADIMVDDRPRLSADLGGNPRPDSGTRSRHAQTPSKSSGMPRTSWSPPAPSSEKAGVLRLRTTLDG